jgi:hypothetical protein
VEEDDLSRYVESDYDFNNLDYLNNFVRPDKLEEEIVLEDVYFKHQF